MQTLGKGMFQRLWTLSTLSLSMYYLNETRIKVEFMGCGDNIIASIKIPKTHTNRETQMVVFSQFNQMSEDAEILIKLGETFVSTNCFEYNKISLYNGRRIPLNQRKDLKLVLNAKRLYSLLILS